MIKADRQTDGSFIVTLDTVDYVILHKIQVAYSMTYDQALICCIHKGMDRIEEIIAKTATSITERQNEQEPVEGG